MEIVFFFCLEPSYSIIVNVWWQCITLSKVILIFNSCFSSSSLISLSLFFCLSLPSHLISSHLPHSLPTLSVSVCFGLKVTETILRFHVFFFLHVNSKIIVQEKKILFVHCSYTVYILFMGPTILFTHLKIIFLQCFQFSVSTAISSIQTDPLSQSLYPSSFSNRSLVFFFFFFGEPNGLHFQIDTELRSVWIVRYLHWVKRKTNR